MLTASATEASATEYPQRGTARAWLILICIAGALWILDRQILVLMVHPVRAELQINDTQFSLFQGTAFAIFYCLMGVPAGLAADKFSRRNLIVLAILFWSVMTAACGLAQSFWAMLLARVGLAAGEAMLQPAVFSILCDSYRPAERGRAFGAFGFGQNVGILLSLFGGGLLMAWLTRNQGTLAPIFTPLLPKVTPWREALLLLSLPGVLLALLMLLLREPPRQPTATAETESIFVFMRRHWRVAAPVLFTYALMSGVGFAVMSWAPAAYMRVYGASYSETGAIMGLIILSGALGGSIGGGVLADWFSQRKVLGRKLRVATVGAFSALPLAAAWWLVHDRNLSVAIGMLLWILVAATSTTGPIAINELAPPALRGRLSAFYLIFTIPIGETIGTLLPALATDYVFKDDKAVGYSIMLVTLPTLLACGLLTFWVRRPYSELVDRQTAN